ncbi:OmpP1/FadL family transporter [Thermodesulfobacteriota bacterium]
MTRAFAANRFMTLQLAFAALLCFPYPCRADYASTYGLSARGTAMGNAYTAIADDCTAAFHNPAALVLPENNSIMVGYFYGLPQVELDRVSAGGSTFDAALTAPQIGLTVDLGRIVSFTERKVVFGLFVSHPDNLKIASWVRPAPETNLQYASFGRVHDLLVMAFGLGVDVTKWLSVGYGFRYNVTYNAKSMVLTLDPVTLDFVYNTVDVRSENDITPAVGLLVHPGGRWSAGLSWRKEHTAADVKGHGRAGLQLLPDFGISLPVNFALYDFYSPREISIGGAWWFGEKILVSLEVTHEEWRGFNSPYGDDDIGRASFRDVIVPRIGFERTTERGLALRFGYWYHPSVVRTVQPETAYLDPDRHVLSAGIGVPWSLDRWVRLPLQVDAFVQGHILPRKHFDVVGEKVSAGGAIFVAGITLRLDILGEDAVN